MRYTLAPVVFATYKLLGRYALLKDKVMFRTNAYKEVLGRLGCENKENISFLYEYNKCFEDRN